jgi:hypothetical protein
VAVELSGEAIADFQMSSTRMSRIAGIVRSSKGAITNASISIRGVDSMGQEVFSVSRVNADGSFVFTNVSPGDHVIEARTGASPNADSNDEAGSLRISTDGENIDGVMLLINPMSSLSGRVVIDGSRLNDNASFRVTAQRPTDARVVASAPVDARGNFQLKHLAGEVLLEISGPPNLILKSTVAEGADVTDSLVDFTNPRDVTGVTIVASFRAAKVVGRVTNREGLPQNDYVAVFVRLTSSSSVVPGRVVKTARPFQDGGFTLDDLRSGDYAALALTSLEDGAEWNPEFQANVRKRGQRIIVAEDRELTVNLLLDE